MSPTIQVISQWVGLAIQVGTLIGLLYALTVFLEKPNTSQNERIAALEAWQKDVDRRLEKGDGQFTDVKDANKVTQEALLALLSHAIDGNNTEELKQAKKNLNDYLIKK